MRKKKLCAVMAAGLLLTQMSGIHVYAEKDTLKDRPVFEEITEEPEEPIEEDFADIASDEASIRGFVVRLYRIVLEREPDSSGFKDWTEGITSGRITGCNAVKGFFLSDEMIKRNLPNEEYVTLLYQAVLNREPDDGGLAAWTERLNVLMTREYVINGFLNSPEFSELCKTYGVTLGSTGTTAAYRDRRYLVTAFVYRLYTKVLGRSADVGGVEDWTKRIYTQGMPGAELAAGFFLSQEYINKNTDNTTYVKTLYRAVLDREGSSAEVSSWAAELTAGKSRKEVLAGFVNSTEFGKLCSKYGIERGTLVLEGWKVINGKQYYIKANGQMAAKEILTINGKQYGFNAKGVWIGEKNDSYLSAYGKAISLVNSITNDAMTDEQKLRICFDVFGSFTEKNPWIPHYMGAGWLERYANHCFDTHIGNCISYAACFGLMAQVIGYENIYCINNGHGWVEINSLVYDPEWQLHHSGNYYARPLSQQGDQNYQGAINRSVPSNNYVKL